VIVPQISPLVRAYADGREHGCIAHNTANAHLFVAGIKKEVFYTKGAKK